MELPSWPGIRHLLPGCEERASHLASILGFHKPGLAQNPDMDLDPRNKDLPLKPNAFGKTQFFSLFLSGDLSPARHDDPMGDVRRGRRCLS
ncbi:caspase recruitment domain-containing protein 10 [Limosa lapponica baueri]|uniref:Caspase recruitment domain-containing protein 10 n=1 Tax=Limosa lapponica baueri TaxID=1758121 RepID=A0A2I0USN7_LIMLA|nr:caspase recruitment domain-containing protein 10 [Limosa lapponica baueri]